MQQMEQNVEMRVTGIEMISRKRGVLADRNGTNRQRTLDDAGGRRSRMLFRPRPTSRSL